MSKKQLEFFNLMTEAGEKLGETEDVWQQYPRLQLVRDNWQSLNGIWDLDGSPVRVPFPPESRLANYSGTIKTRMTYTRYFTMKSMENKKRTILHFGAVDQFAEVYLNDIFLGKHEGGYFPFSFDITDAVKEDNCLIVKVVDELNKDYPYGKQCQDRGGMWYTPTSGIWQSVWIEQVPQSYIQDIRITPDLQGIWLQVDLQQTISMKGTAGLSNETAAPTEKVTRLSRSGADTPIEVEIQLHNGECHKVTLSTSVDKNYIDLSKIITTSGEVYKPKLWELENPYLYTLTLHVGEDTVQTYFALRTIEIKDIKGIQRVCLNGKPIFMHGVLDQGYYSDGIITPADEAEYERDILRMKELGINLLRKHIKIEPECFYYYCDKHGMLVMQDMVSNGYYSYVRDTVLPTIGFLHKKDHGKGMNAEQKRIFEEHMLETQELLYNHPSVIAYTIFNEGWGQFESDRMYGLAKKKDTTRLYDATSGWFAQRDNDFDSIHIYFGPRKPKVKKRPLFLSEFGGYSFGVSEHIYTNKSYGYGTCKDSVELFKRIQTRYEELVLPYIEAGLCGSIYTQVSDVEDEINGFYTYDRKVCKIDKASMLKLAERIYSVIDNI